MDDDGRIKHLGHYRIHRNYSHSLRIRDNRKRAYPRNPFEEENILKSVDVHEFGRSVKSYRLNQHEIPRNYYYAFQENDHNYSLITIA